MITNKYLYLLSNCLVPAPITPSTIAKSIAKDPYSRGLLSDNLEINFEKKLRFSTFTILYFSTALLPHRKMYRKQWQLRQCTITSQTMFLNENYLGIVRPFDQLVHQ